MTILLTTVASIAALIAGYLGWPLVWLLLLALGYFFPVSLTHYDQTMALLRQERVGLVTFSFLWMYFASLVGVSVTYGVGMVAKWLVQSIF